ncbi:MAG: hypothetical protein WCI77_02725 [Candidatus Omnitrophota bacterium]
MAKEIKSEGLEYISHKGKLICIIVRNSYCNNKVIFFTPQSFSQQLGFLPHKKGDFIKPHKHKLHKREIFYTQEVLWVKKGKVRVDLYSEEEKFLCSEVLIKGEIILLCGGGHGVEVLEDSVMIEVKQGPYKGPEDKQFLR